MIDVPDVACDQFVCLKKPDLFLGGSLNFHGNSR